MQCYNRRKHTSFIMKLVTCVALMVCFVGSASRAEPLKKIANNDTERQGSSQTKPCNQCACGMPGIPGTHGMPGTPGPAGATGRDGPKGEKGVPGRRAPMGPPGPKGNQGVQGIWGKPGKTGHPGKTGPRGPPGEHGRTGLPGNMGLKGHKGESGQSGGVAGQGLNWKQCVWKRDDNKDSGKIQECAFIKRQTSTSLKVSYQGNLRVLGRGATCIRWYFTFNDQECTGPVPIEAVFYYSWPTNMGAPNLLNHRSIEGYCTNIPRGTIRVALWVGGCPEEKAGAAHTGWNSVSRIMMEEVPPPQQ